MAGPGESDLFLARNSGADGVGTGPRGLRTRPAAHGGPKSPWPRWSRVDNRASSRNGCLQAIRPKEVRGRWRVRRGALLSPVPRCLQNWGNGEVQRAEGDIVSFSKSDKQGPQCPCLVIPSSSAVSLGCVALRSHS